MPYLYICYRCSHINFKNYLVLSPPNPQTRTRPSYSLEKQLLTNHKYLRNLSFLLHFVFFASRLSLCLLYDRPPADYRQSLYLHHHYTKSNTTTCALIPQILSTLLTYSDKSGYSKWAQMFLISPSPLKGLFSRGCCLIWMVL